METYHGETLHATVHEGCESTLGSHHVPRDSFVLARVPVLQTL